GPTILEELSEVPDAPRIIGRFGDYELIEEISRGGMGVVYKARQQKPRRIVALKMILAGPWASAEDVQRFHAEAEAAANLDHPHIVPIHEVGEQEGRHFFSMRLIDGENLHQKVARGLLDPREGTRIIRSVAEAIAYAHARGVIHRDLKPANILLDRDGRPHVTDFGLAKRVEGDSGLTATGQILGTPGYMPPEQAAGRTADIGPRVDVYALGALLYFLLTGRPPFQSANAIDTLKQVIENDPAPPRKLNAAVPRDLEAICLKCLEKRPDDRYDTAQALADDLGRFLDGEPVIARQAHPFKRAWRWLRRRPAAAAAIGASLLLLISAGAWAWSSYQERQERRERAAALAPQAREILQRNCHECHGKTPDAVERDLDVLDHALLIGGARRLVVPGDADRSRLIQRIEDGSMPPEEEEIRLPRVSQQELEILREWIALGAPRFVADDPASPTPPVVPDSPLALEVKRIFIRRCYECHRYEEAKGGIKILNHRLLTHVRHVVVPGEPEQSELYQLITRSDIELVMPPQPLERLNAEEIATVRRWIAEGAPPFPKGE
ncbi:MAG: protein kinase domain-containing protein, partial [Planctomycetaceae bacterium]